MSEGGLFIPIDLTHVTSDFTPMPEGIYTVQVEKLEPKTSQAGNKMIAVTFIVVSPAEYMGRKGFTNLSLTPQAAWKLKEFVQACAIPFTSSGFDLSQAQGRQLLVKVVQEQYTTKDGSIAIRNTYEEFLPSGG